MIAHSDEKFGNYMTKVFDNVGAFLLGRETFLIFQSYWPKITGKFDVNLFARKLRIESHPNVSKTRRTRSLSS